jgi:hypothetical protein
MGSNVLENVVWIFFILVMLLTFGIGVNVADRVFTNTTAMLNSTLASYNYTNISNPNYNLTKSVYLDTLPLYSELRTFWIDAIHYVIIMLIAFMFISSMTRNVNMVEYAYLFCASIFLTALCGYLFLSLYNAMSVQFATLGFSTDTFYGYLINNYQALFVFNILGFLANVIYQRFVGGGVG